MAYEPQDTPYHVRAMQHLLGLNPYLDALATTGTALGRETAIPLMAGWNYLATPPGQKPDISAEMLAARQSLEGFRHTPSAGGQEALDDAQRAVLNVLEKGGQVYDTGFGMVKPAVESRYGQAALDHLGNLPQHVKDGLAATLGLLDVATLGGKGPAMMGGLGLLKQLDKATPSTATRKFRNIMNQRAPLSDYENPISFTQRNSNIQSVPSGRARPIRRVQSGPNKGQIVGGPSGLTTSQGLGALRNRLYQTLTDGIPGRLWYDESSQTIHDLTQGTNKRHLYAGSNAITSRGAQVAGNQGFGVKGYNQVITGSPVDTGRFVSSQSRAIEDLGAGNYAGGPKETPFYEALTIFDRPQGVRPTNDIWVARAFDYRKPDGSIWDAGFSQQQHSFIDGEMQRLVDKANKNKLGGFTDWTPERVQAAMWVAQKAQDEGISVQQAAKNFSDNLDNMTASMRWESTPSTSLDHLPGVSGSEQYNDIMRKAVTTDDGRDRLALDTGLLTRETVPGYGEYGGVTSPSNEMRVLAGAETGSPLIDPASDAAARSVAAGRNITMGQDVTGLTFQRPNTGKNVIRDANGNIEKNIARVDLGGTPDKQAMVDINQALKDKFGTDDVFALHTDNGVQIVNVGVDNADFQKGLKQLYRQETKEFGYNSGDLVGNVPWSGDPGYKVSTNIDIIDQQNLGPAALNRLEKGMQNEADTLLKIDRLIEKDVPGSGATSSVLMKAREVLVKDGLQGLRDAVKKGVLPVAVLGLLGMQAGQTSQVPQKQQS